MRFIGLDIAATTGWAYRTLADEYGPSHWERGTVRGDSRQKHDILAHAKEHGVTHAVCEKPVAFAGSHAHTVVGMAATYGRWLEALDIAGIIVVPCIVRQWQSAMLVYGGNRLKQNDKKEASILVSEMLGCTTNNGDIADAVCLCCYGPQALAKVEFDEEEKRVTRNAKAKLSRTARKERANGTGE